MCHPVSDGSRDQDDSLERETRYCREGSFGFCHVQSRPARPPWSPVRRLDDRFSQRSPSRAAGLSGWSVQSSRRRPQKVRSRACLRTAVDVMIVPFRPIGGHGFPSILRLLSYDRARFLFHRRPRSLGRTERLDEVEHLLQPIFRKGAAPAE